MDEDEAYSYDVLIGSRFWVQRVLVPILLCLGLLGNTITVMVLTRRRMRSSTNTYLSALACADIIHLLFGFLLSFEHYPNIHDKKYELYWRFYGLTHWLCDAASATSAWLAVSFTIERYIAVCHPMKGKLFCTERRAKRVIVIVYIFCILTTASTTFEYQLSFTDTCVQECLIDASRNNTTKAESDVTASINKMEPTNPTFEYAALQGYDRYVQKQLKHILSNCTSHPHIILVPVYPYRLNTTKDVEKTTLNMEEELERVLNIVDPNNTIITLIDVNNESTIEDNPILTTNKVTRSTEIRLNNNASPDDNIDSSNANDTVTDISHSPINSTYCCVPYKQIYVENTELGKSKTYTDFIYWYSAVFFAILPLLLIGTFNCFLVRAVYLSQKTRRVMTNSQDSVSWTNEKRITIMLIGIVFAFLICSIPTAIHLIYYHFHEPKNKVEINIRLILGNFCNFMVMLNAPCNFLIYCLLSKKFRMTFKKIFWEKRRGTQMDAETILLSSTKTKDSNKFSIYKHGLMKRHASEYRTPRNLETHSLTSMPRSKSLMMRPIGKAKSCDLNV